VPGQQFVTTGHIFEWAQDDRTGLWGDFVQPFERKWMEFGEPSITTTPIDLPGVEQAVNLFDDGARVMIRTDEGGGTVYMGAPLGPYSPVLGAGAGQARVSSASMAVDGSHVLRQLPAAQQSRRHHAGRGRRRHDRRVHGHRRG